MHRPKVPWIIYNMFQQTALIACLSLEGEKNMTTITFEVKEKARHWP